MNAGLRRSTKRILLTASAATAGFLAVVAAAAPEPQTGSARAAAPAPGQRVGPSDPLGWREGLIDRSYVYTVEGHSTLVGPSSPLGDPPLDAPGIEGPSYPPPPEEHAPAVPINTPDIPLGVVSGFNFDEPLARVNPTNPLNVVITSHRGLRPSVDGGATYLGTVLYPATLGGSNGDTAMAFDSQGRLFWANLLLAGDGDVQLMQVNPTTGGTITGPINVQTAAGDGVAGFDDKEFLAADEYVPSAFTDNLYMIWTKFGATTDVYYSRSTNQGAAWSTPLVFSVPAEGFPWPSDIAVAPNGDVYAAYHSGGDTGAVGDTWVLRSTNGGVTFPQKNQAFLPGQSDVTFNVKSAAGSIPNTQFWMQGSVQPWVLPDPARPGNVYVVNNDDPDNTHASGDDADVVIARSVDNGLNWAVTTIPDGSGGAHQVFPFAAIDQLGNIAVAWYDTRRGLTNGFNRLLLDVFATYSLDGGLTWATPFMVNDPNNPFDPDFPNNQRRFPTPQITPCGKVIGSTETCRIGEYMGIDIDRGRVFVTWEGNAFDAGGNVTGDQQWTDSFSIANPTVTKTDGVAVAVPGTNTIYTIVVSNSGPGPAAATQVNDTFPAACSSVTWTCSGAGGGVCPAPAGAGNLATTADLPAGGSVTFLATCAVNPAATGNLSNTVTVAAGPGVDDTNLGNNSANDVDSLSPTANVSITKTDGAATAVPGTDTVYLITAANAGPSNAPAAVVTDNFPAACTSVTWSCAGAGGGTCPANGVGNINTAVYLPAGGSVAFSSTCSIDPAATGDLVNSASVTPGPGVVDPVPGNNTSTDTDTLTPQADISVIKTADPIAVDVGDTVTFTIVVANGGPSDAPGVTVQDLFPPGFSANLEWTCTGQGGGVCTPAGVGDIVDIVDLPAGASVTYVASCSAFAPVDADVTNTASVTMPAGVIDPDPSDQESSATVAINAFAIQEIPTLDRSGLAVLLLLLGAAGWLALRRPR